MLLQKQHNLFAEFFFCFHLHSFYIPSPHGSTGSPFLKYFWSKQHFYVSVYWPIKEANVLLGPLSICKYQSWWYYIYQNINSPLLKLNLFTYSCIFIIYTLRELLYHFISLCNFKILPVYKYQECTLLWESCYINIPHGSTRSHCHLPQVVWKLFLVKNIFTSI